MTSNDRHASHNSPYRTGQHVPLPQSRHAALNLTSVATDAADSRTDLSSSANPSSLDVNKQNATSTVYSPGMRSLQRKQSSDDSTRGEIQMQNFTEGLPPAPPVGHSWKRIEGWVESNYEELFDQLGEGCSQNDINELEHELDCTLPMEVRESLQVHDGQERGGLPTGIIFGCMLLDCEEIVQEWKNWRRVSQDFLRRQPTITIDSPQVPSKAFAGPSSSKDPPPSDEPQQANSMWREDLLAKQDSQPPNAIRKAYTHVSWIPVARDWGGNCLAVDLAPGPAGKWGQVIIMGRDYDCKYVVARSWAAFLANVADDISTPKVFVHEETGELKLREFKQQGVEPSYLNIIRWRVDQKYGRKGPRRRPISGDTKANASGSAVVGRGSPYGSPIDNDRGRSPQRFQQRNALSGSPRATISSPLARVAEEPLPAAVQIHSGASSPRKNSFANESLLKIDSRRDSELLLPSPLSESTPLTASAPIEEPNKENRKSAGTGLGVKNIEINGVEDTDGMKDVQL